MFKKNLAKFIAILIIIPLTIIHFTTEFDSSFLFGVQIELTSDEAEARQTYEPAHLANEICWETGEQLLICRYGGGVCDVSDQGSCSPPIDPIVN